jgi:hypothetical protein
MGFYHDAAADCAYEDSRNGFDMHRDKLQNRALDAHERGDEDEAQRLLAESRGLVYTGLNWQEDNGLMDDLYAYPPGFQEEIDPEYRASK